MKLNLPKNIIAIAAYSLISISIFNIIIVFSFNRKPDKNVNSAKIYCESENNNCSKKSEEVVLKSSLDRGINFILNHQKEEGNFHYSYNIHENQILTTDNQIRQAETLWALVQFYLFKEDDNILKSIGRNYGFFSNSFRTSDNKRWIIYPGDETGKSGTQAMFALAMMDFLMSKKDHSVELYKKMNNDIHSIISMILQLQDSDSRFHQYYEYKDGKGYGKATAYTDTQCLLALVRYAKHFNRKDLKDIILKSAEKTYSINVSNEAALSKNSKKTKNFFKWGIMLTYDLSKSGWKNTDKFSVNTIELADWIINQYNIMERNNNSSYAIEGLIYGYLTAKEKDDIERRKIYLCIINCLMNKFLPYQLGFGDNKKFMGRDVDKLVIGGVLLNRRNPKLRIDLTYKQMNAILLALKYIK